MHARHHFQTHFGFIQRPHHAIFCQFIGCLPQNPPPPPPEVQTNFQRDPRKELKSGGY